MPTLTKDQYNTLIQKGLSGDQIASIAKNKGYDLPKDEGLLKKVENVATSIFPGKKVGQAIGTLAGAGISKLQGTYDNYDLSAPNVKQVVGDVAKGVATVAGAKLPVAGSIAGKAAQFGTVGAVSAAGEAATQDKSVGQIAKDAAIGGAVGAGVGTAFGVAEKGVKAAGNFLGKTGDKIQVSVIKPTKADIDDGFSLDTIKKYDLGGPLKTSFSKTESNLDTLSKELNQKLASSNTAVDLNKVYENTAKKLLGNKFESFGSNSQLENTIEKLRGEIVTVSGPNGVVSVPEAQIVKRASGHYGAWTYGNNTPEVTASQRVYNVFYNELKEAIEKASPDGVKEINKKISELIPVMNAIIRRIPVAERNATLSLSDIISLSAGALEPRALSVSLLNLASKSGTVGRALSNNAQSAGNTVGNAIQKVGTVTRASLGL